jgi:hypothetical protein
MENTCGDVFSYEINGEGVTFLGYEDAHDRDWDYLEVLYPFASLRTSDKFAFSDASVKLNEDQCAYSLRIYPSDELHERGPRHQNAVIGGASIGLVAISQYCSETHATHFENRKGPCSPSGLRERMLGHKNESKKQGEVVFTVSQMQPRAFWMDQMVEVVLSTPRQERLQIMRSS